MLVTKLKDSVRAVALLGLLTVCLQVSAQGYKDVTDTYIRNANLALKSTGWTYSRHTTDGTEKSWSTTEELHSGSYISEVYAGDTWKYTDFTAYQTVKLPRGTYHLIGRAFQRSVPNTVMFARQAGDTATVNVVSVTGQFNTVPNNTSTSAKSFNANMYLNDLEITVAADTAEVTIGYSGEFTAAKQWFIMGAFTLYEVQDELSATYPIDITPQLSRCYSSFTGVTGTYTKADKYIHEKYSGSNFAAGDMIYQTFTGLTNGIYEVVINADASKANSVGSLPATNPYVFAGDTQQEVVATEKSAVSTVGEYTLTGVTVHDGTMKVGFHNTAVGSNWYLFNVKSVKYTGSDAFSSYKKTVTDGWDALKVITDQALDHTAFDAAVAQGMAATDTTSLLAADEVVRQAYRQILTTGATATGLFDITTLIKDQNSLAELFDATTGDVNHTLTDMPKGHYTVKVQAFHRSTSYGKSNINYENGTDVVSAKLYLGEAAVAVKNINDDSRYVSALPSTDVAGAFQRSIPNTLDGAGKAFDKGLYWNILQADLAEDGDIVFGLSLNNGQSNNWLAYNNFRLYYGAPIATISLKQDEPMDIASDAYANVVTDIQLKAGTLNRLCVPFDMDETQTSSTFANVYTLAGVEADGTTLNGTLVPVYAIKAGQGYFVEVEEDKTLAADGVVLHVAQPDSIPVIWDGAATVGSYNGYGFDIKLPEVYQSLAETLTLNKIDFANVSFTTNLENWQARRLVNDNIYDENSTSVVANYNVSPPGRRDQPHSVFIPVPAGNSAMTATVSLNSDFSEALKMAFKANTTLCEIPNLIPQHTYYYKVVADGKTLTQGQFKTEGHLRMIKANSGSNIRDLGGWLNADGQRIRYGRVYRGGELNGAHVMNEADIAVLRGLGITTEIDLREDVDISGYGVNGSALGSDVNYAYENLSRWGSDAMKQDTAKFRDAFHTMLTALKAGGNVYFHCIWGADRTGCFAFLLEGLLGLPVDQLYKDYELTSFSIAGTREKTGLDSKLGYVKTFAGNTLQKKFFNYWNQQVGISGSNLLEFIDIMVDSASVSQTELAISVVDSSYQQKPAAITLMCAKGSTVAEGKKAVLQTVDGKATQLDITIDGIVGSFGNLTLAAGQTYTLTVPAGTIVDREGKANAEDVTAIFLTPSAFDGDYYLYLPTLGAFLGRGGDYGTRGITDNYGTPVSIKTTTEGTTTVKYFVGDAYLGSDGFTDKSSSYSYVDWTMQNVGEGFVLKSANGYYLEMYEGTRARVDAESMDDATPLTAITNDERQTILQQAAEDNRALLLADYVQGETLDIIKAATSGSTAYWVLKEPTYKMNASYNGYNVGEYGGELYLKHGSVSQTVTVPRAGLYKLTLNVLYRQGKNEECYEWGQRGYVMSNAYVSINDTYHAMIPDWYSGCVSATNPNDTAEAKVLMNEGKYAIELYANIGDDLTATIAINVPGYVDYGWCLFNNFLLTEYVKNTATGINTVGSETQAPDDRLYNLSGQRVGESYKGIVVRNGRKYVRK